MPNATHDAERPEIEPQLRRDAREKILDDDIRAPRQLEGERRAVGLLKIHGDATLVAVACRERRAHPVIPAQVAQVVAAARTFDLHDVGAEIPEKHRAEGARDDAREIEDADALEHHRSRNPSVIALTSGMPVRAIALMRAFISESGRNGLAAMRCAQSVTAFPSRSRGTTWCTGPSAAASRAA